MSFYLDDAYNDDDLTVRISNGGIRGEQNMWKGILMEPISFSANASFDPIAGSSTLDALEDFRQGAEIAGRSSNNRVGQKLADLVGGITFRLQKLTVKNWSGTTDPVINISFAMINNDQVQNVFQQYYNLHAQLYPDLSSAQQEASSGDTGFALIPPYGFSPASRGGNNSSSNGLWSVDVGRWFTAHNMILADVTVTSSLTLDDTPENQNAPEPMYAAVNCVFTTERAATRREVLRWLRSNLTN